MSLLFYKVLNECIREVHNTKIISMGSLSVGWKYPLEMIQKEETRFGVQTSTILTIPATTAQNHGMSAKVYLPKRVNDKITTNQMDQLNKGGACLRYLGVGLHGSFNFEFLPMAEEETISAVDLENGEDILQKSAGPSSSSTMSPADHKGKNAYTLQKMTNSWKRKKN